MRPCRGDREVNMRLRTIPSYLGASVTKLKARNEKFAVNYKVMHETTNVIVGSLVISQYVKCQRTTFYLTDDVTRGHSYYHVDIIIGKGTSNFFNRNSRKHESSSVGNERDGHTGNR